MTMVRIAYLVLNVRGHRIHTINNTLCLIFYIYIQVEYYIHLYTSLVYADVKFASLYLTG